MSDICVFGDLVLSNVAFFRDSVKAVELNRMMLLLREQMCVYVDHS